MKPSRRTSSGKIVKPIIIRRKKPPLKKSKSVSFKQQMTESEKKQFIEDNKIPDYDIHF